VIKGDVTSALRAIWLGREQGFECLNNALITLLPKKTGAVDLSDFRPISLVHSFARLLTKILARRLAPRMPELVNANQTAFIQGRCIQDNFLLVQESAKVLHAKNEASLLFKVDIAKAFDSISWPFLLSVLRQRGFGTRWIRWISLLLRTARTQVLVNGFEGDAFLHGRGLRQGDPISPLLFVIAMDVLAAMFCAAERAGILSHFGVAGIKHRVSLYADDVVVFAKPDRVELHAVRSILDHFGKASGLLVNFAKSAVAPIRCPEVAIPAVRDALSCQVVSLPCTYLGLPLSIRKLRKVDLQPVLDKLAGKLSYWRARLMTREGRAVYVQAVMTATVIYHLMALDLEPWFLQAVDKLRRGFLWAGSSDANGGCCAVAWDLVCQPKELGGLGFHNLRLLNTALRTRWLWFQRMGDAKPWSGLDIAVSKDTRALFNASVSVSVGDGSSILFWVDAWIDGVDAGSIAPALVKLVRPSVRRARTVADGLSANAWASDIGGELTVEALREYLALWNAIQRVPRRGLGEDDAFRWKWTSNGRFSSKSAYRTLFHGTVALPGAANVWNSFAPLKFKMHAWLALRRRCWTADRRRRRGLRTHIMCPLCGSRQETLDHITLQCPFAMAIWAGAVARLGLPNIVPSEHAAIGEWWPEATARFTPSDRRTANSFIMLVMRTLWLERNARVFNQKATTAQTLLRLLLDEWKAWMSCRRGSRRVVE
jgi:hypothetical protein